MMKIILKFVLDFVDFKRISDHTKNTFQCLLLKNLDTSHLIYPHYIYIDDNQVLFAVHEFLLSLLFKHVNYLCIHQFSRKECSRMR